MFLRLREYRRPTGWDQALELIHRASPPVRILAGGTAVVGPVDDRTEVLVDLRDLGLRWAQEDGGVWRFGAMTTLADVLRLPPSRRPGGRLLAVAIDRTGPPTLLNRATLGGAVARPDRAGELVAALLALDARVALVRRDPAGRVVLETHELSEFVARRAALLEGAIIERLELPPSPAATALLRVARTPRDVPIVSVSVALELQGGQCRRARVAAFGLSDLPCRVRAAESLLEGRPLDEAAILQAARAAREAAEPPEDFRASSAYRRHLAEVLVRRALQAALGEARAQTGAGQAGHEASRLGTELTGGLGRGEVPPAAAPGRAAGEIQLVLNGERRQLHVDPGETLLRVLRREGLFGVKHGCDTGECGACVVLLNGAAVTTCNLLAAQADGAEIRTVENLGELGRLHPLQARFVENGAVQCGFCTPGMLMAACALLDEQPDPDEAAVRRALSSVICRCTGYVKPVEAVLRAAADLRKAGPPSAGPRAPSDRPAPDGGRPHVGAGLQDAGDSAVLAEGPAPFGGGPKPEGGAPPAPGAEPAAGEPEPATAVAVVERPRLRVVGQPVPKVDAAKLVTGRAAFVDDIELRGLLHARLLLSPHAHARIRRIDARRARELPGVYAVLTYQDLPRISFTTAGQSWPEPSPYDTRSLDDKVRFVGDRVAAVAARTPEIAEQALRLIEVEYEVLPAVFDPEEALKPGAPVIHDEPDCWGPGGYDPAHNIAARVEASVGDVERGLAEADVVLEATYRVPQVQQAPLETHICITYLDEDGRLVVRSSTQVPFHARRIIARALGLRVGQVRVIKPRIGGGFGAKQEVLIEDICGHLTLRTGRPVRLELSREEEFMASRSRHPQVIRMRSGVKRDGTLVANEMIVLANTGAYGSHALTVQSNTGSKSLPLYRCPNVRYQATAVYTNLPPAGAFRGYGAPQGFFALESHMDELARAIGMDPLEFRLKNCLRAGDENPLAVALGEGREGFEQRIESCGLPECAEFGRKAIGWDRPRPAPSGPRRRRGLGVAFAMHGTAIPGLDMGAASLKMNDDGTFNLLVGATDIGTGADTVLAQMAAEVLGCEVEDILVYSSDTDMTPFDTGAYASSTTYISGGAVVRAAQQVADQIRSVASRMLGVAPDDLELRERSVVAPDGRRVSLADVALHALHVADQRQIMAVASHMSYHSPPPFAATFAEVEVDEETGLVEVIQLVTAVDAGQVINPATAQGQVEGGMVQALGYALCEEMRYDSSGRMVNASFRDYRVWLADELPRIVAHLVPVKDPHGPYGAKAVAEIPMDGVAPAVANAVRDAVGVRIREIPLTPERVFWQISGARGGKGAQGGGR